MTDLISLGFAADTRDLQAAAGVLDRLPGQVAGVERAAGALGSAFARLAQQVAGSNAAWTDEARAAEAARGAMVQVTRVAGQVRSAMAAMIDTAASVADRFETAGRAATFVLQNYNQLSAGVNLLRRNWGGLAVDTAEIVEDSNRAGQAVGLLRGALAAAGVSIGVRQYTDYADAMRNLEARLGLVSDATGTVTVAQRALYRIAQDARQPLEQIGDLYLRIAQSSEQLHLSQSQTLALTQDISRAMALGGGSAQSQAAALVQLGQGFNEGMLRGDNFNSMMEQAPGLARAMAAGLGVPRGALRAMAEQGELTAVRIAAAMASQHEAIERDFATLPATVSGAATRMENAILASIQRLDGSARITGIFTGLFDRITARFEDPRFLDQAAAILSRFAVAARAAAEVAGFLVEHLDQALAAFAVFAGARGALLAIGAVSSFRLGVLALTRSLALLGVEATLTQRAVAGAGAAFALSNPLAAVISAVTALGIGYVALADHSSTASRAVDAANRAIDATNAPASAAARSLEEMGRGYREMTQAARGEELRRITQAIAEQVSSINEQRDAVRRLALEWQVFVPNLRGAPGAALSPGLGNAPREEIAAVQAAMRAFLNAPELNGEVFVRLRQRLTELANAHGEAANGPLRQFIAAIGRSVDEAARATDQYDLNTIRATILANAQAGLADVTEGLSAAQIELARRMGLVGASADDMAARVADAAAAMRRALAATGGDLTRDIERAQALAEALAHGGLRAYEEQQRVFRAESEAQQRWRAAWTDMVRGRSAEERQRWPEQLSDALSSDNAEVRSTAEHLQGQISQLAELNNQNDRAADALRAATRGTGGAARTAARQDDRVETVEAEIAGLLRQIEAYGRSEAAVLRQRAAQEAATAVINHRIRADQAATFETGRYARALAEAAQQAAQDLSQRRQKLDTDEAALRLMRESGIGQDEAARQAAALAEQTRLLALAREAEAAGAGALGGAYRRLAEDAAALTERQRAVTFGQRIEGLRADLREAESQASLLGLSGQALAVQQRQLQQANDLRRAGIGLQSEQAQKEIALAGEIARTAWRTQQWGELYQDIGTGFGDLARTALLHWQDFGDTATRVLEQIAEDLMRLAVIQPLESSILGLLAGGGAKPGSGLAGGVLGGIGSALGSGLASLIGGGGSGGGTSYWGALGKDLGGSGGGLSGALSGIGSFLGFAEGGRPPLGVPSLVGEAGPEWFVPDTPGTIYPNGMMPAWTGPAWAGGEGRTVNWYAIDARGAQDPAAVEAAVDRALQRRVPGIVALSSETARRQLISEANHAGPAAKAFGRR